MSDSFDVKGLDELAANLRKRIESMRSNINDELSSFANDVYTKSQDEVPIDKGTLKLDSGIDHDKENLSVTVWYGRGEARDHAIPVHENPSEHDPTTWKGKKIQFTHGGSKYLERPLNELRGEFESRMAKMILKD